MALDFFSKLKKGKAAPEAPFKRDLAKAASFFRHAETTAESRQWDYAIDCYISGLRHDPDNVTRHEELREVAKRRKVAKGKPATLKEKLAKSGSDPIDKMLHDEMLWSKDTLNISHAMNVMEQAIEANAEEKDLQFGEVAYWAGQIILEMNQARNQGDKDTFLEVCELFRRIPAYDKAAEAARLAEALDPTDEEVQKLLQDLVTELTMAEGRYGEGKEGDFRANVVDTQHQRELAEDDTISKTRSTVETIIDRRRREYEEDPEDLDRLTKLVSALLDKDSEETENQAIELLQAAWERTNQYKFKMQVGDIRIRQMQRPVRAARKAYEAARDDPNAKEQFQRLALEATHFEVAEFEDRVKNYPTDMHVRYELGRRYFALKQYEEAISEFQKSQGDPRHRAASLSFLGRCFLIQEWLDMAIDTLRQGIEAHGSDSDERGMELRYVLMEALEKSAAETRSLEQATEAQKTAAQILQTNIKYRDIRECMDRIRKLVTELREEQK